MLNKNNSSVRRNSLPGHVNRYSRQLIYETHIFNICSSSKKFLTILNSFAE